MRALVNALAALFVATLVMLGAPQASANSIESIDITVDIQPDGSALVTDHRKFNATEGTEHFISLANLGESEITDFKVTDHGLPMQDIGAWDVNASLEDKAGKYGINYTADGLELCWGIGQLGYRDFTATYRITNFVRNLSDGPQAIYWQFLNPDMDPIADARITIRNSVGLEYDTSKTKIWGFGYSGNTSITPGALTMDAKNLTASDYVVLLAILPEGTVNAQANYPYDAAGIEERAKEGSDWDTGSGGSGSSWWGPLPFLILGGLSQMLFFAGIFVMIFFAVRNNGKVSGSHLNAATGFKSSRTVEPSREIPPIHFSALTGLVDSQPKDWMAAWMLEWIRKGWLTPKPYEAGWLFKRERDGLLITDQARPGQMTVHEREFWNHLVAAAGDNQLLEGYELSRFYQRNRKRFYAWRDQVWKDSTQYLLSHGLVTPVRKGLIFKRPGYDPTSVGQQFRDQIQGLEDFMKNYSLLAEREPVNVHLWDDYLVWAAFLGVAEEVEKQFKIIEPRYTEQSAYQGVSMGTLNHYSSSAASGYTPSSSSGGGGSSSGGGGGGASGGGSGGGTR